MPFIFRFPPTRRDLAVICTQILTQIPLSVDIVDNLPQTHGIRPGGLSIFQWADTQAIAQQKLFVERC